MGCAVQETESMPVEQFLHVTLKFCRKQLLTGCISRCYDLKIFEVALEGSSF